MELLIVITSLLLVSAAAARWGHDSRDGFAPGAGRHRFTFRNVAKAGGNTDRSLSVFVGVPADTQLAGLGSGRDIPISAPSHATRPTLVGRVVLIRDPAPPARGGS